MGRVHGGGGLWLPCPDSDTMEEALRESVRLGSKGRGGVGGVMQSL